MKNVLSFILLFSLFVSCNSKDEVLDEIEDEVNEINSFVNIKYTITGIRQN